VFLELALILPQYKMAAVLGSNCQNVFSFSALSVLVGQQEGHLDSKNMGVGLLMVMT